MDILGRVIGGLVLVAIGIPFVMKTEWFVQNFGAIPWAEQHLGSEGGSRLFYKLVGLVLIFGGFLVATGMMKSFFLGTIGWLFVAKR